MKNLEPQMHTVENPKGQLRFFGGGWGRPFLKKQQGVTRLFFIFINFFFENCHGGWGNKVIPTSSPCFNAKAECPRLNLKAKASIWLVSHPLRSLNTVNERLLYKNISIERVIFACFEFTLLGTPEIQRPATEADSYPF